MNADKNIFGPGQLVDRLVKNVYLSSVTETISLLESPPGRQPPEELTQLHEWFGELTPASRDLARRAFKLVSDSAIFGVLCMLDNVRPVSPGFRDELVVRVRTDGIERDLVDPGIELHALFREAADRIAEE